MIRQWNIFEDKETGFFHVRAVTKKQPGDIEVIAMDDLRPLLERCKDSLNVFLNVSMKCHFPDERELVKELSALLNEEK